MFKKFFLLCFGIFLLSVASKLNGQTTLPQTPANSTPYTYTPGQDVTYLLTYTQLDHLFARAAALLGIAPQRIWYYYNTANVTIWATADSAWFKVEVRVAGNIGILLLETH